jgi:uncharacterized membrane protein
VAGAAPRLDLDAAIGRLLILGTYGAVAILALGVVAMIVAGVGPGDAAPGLDVGRLGADLVALRPAGLLWLGLLAVIATPIGRVVASLVGYAQRRELSMVAVSVAILIVILLSIVLAVTVEA